MPGFVTCGPNEALVISGCCHSKPYLMPGGRVFVWPWLQKIQKISLNTMTLTIESPNVYTKNGVPISLTGISQVKISGNNADKLLSASENFLGKTEAEIIKIVQETLEGHQREIMAKMSVEKIYCDRKDFSKQVYQVASSDLADMGLVVVSYTVKDIHDEEGYLEALGLAQTAKVRMDAKIGEVDEFKDRKIKELNADKERFLAKYKNDTSISKAQHDFDFKKAEFDISIYQEQAKSDLANKLQEEIGKKFLVKEMLQIKIENDYNSEQIIEKEKEIKVLELEGKIRKLVEKEFEKSKIIADAEKEKIIEEGETEYQVIKILGEAQAYGLEKISKAQTDIMALEANVFSDFKSAACINMMLDTLPKIAAEISDPVAKCNKITMVSQGDGEVGVKKFVSEILSVMEDVYSSVNGLSATTLKSNILNEDSQNTQTLPPSSQQTSEAKKSFLGKTPTLSSQFYSFKT